MHKKLFISFDYDNDKHYKYLLEAWSKNNKFELMFTDYSSQRINSEKVSRIKAALTTKIKKADITLVIIGKHANVRHPDHKEIGHRNWINYEISKSIEANNALVAVKIDKEYESPEAILNCGAHWAMSFSEDDIMTALNRACS